MQPDSRLASILIVLFAMILVIGLAIVVVIIYSRYEDYKDSKNPGARKKQHLHQKQRPKNNKKL